MDDYSYLGSGMIHFREYGAAAPFVEAGNCSALNFSPQSESLSLPNYTQPGGGTQNEVQRLTGVEMAYTFHDFSPENFARSLRGIATDAAAGTAVEEALIAYPGGLTPTHFIPDAVTLVTDISGTETYDEGLDYEVRPGGIFIPADSTIPTPVNEEANIEVSYSYVAQGRVEALVNPATQYEVLFVGLNEARSGKPVRIHAHKVSGGVLAQFAALGTEYGGGEVTGNLLLDGTKTGAGVSKYFTVEMVK